MYKFLIFTALVFSLFSCGETSKKNTVKVTNEQELKTAVSEAKPGDEIVLAEGVWKDVQINFVAKGTEAAPIVLRAETEGKVSLEGQSCLRLAGEYLTVSGLYFKNGFTPGRSVIQFRLSKDSIANRCRVTNCVIEDFSQPVRWKQDYWVEFWGRNNQLDHCYLAGKFNQGPTLRVNQNGNEHILNYHKITNNHFGPRPRKGGPKAETIQIGDSYTSMTPGYVNVSDNFFEKCNGEVEIVSNKTNFNEFRNNIFFECEGSLVLRHGNYCTVDGNVFIGSDDSQFFGGIRVINTGHWVTNNYFYKLKGAEFRGPLAIMNGIPKSPLNRYNQVTDVVVAYNSWIDCRTPWHLSVGANIDKKDVLPASEIRSARPRRTLIANNLIYNFSGDSLPVKTYDKPDGFTFKKNIIDNQTTDYQKFDGLISAKTKMENPEGVLYFPAAGQDDVFGKTFTGFGFEAITQDVLGNKRAAAGVIGALAVSPEKGRPLIDRSLYGASWFSGEKPAAEANVISVSGAEGELAAKLAEAAPGDVLELTDSLYNLSASLVIDKTISLRAKGEMKAKITFSADENSPVFLMHPKGYLDIKNIVLIGENGAHTFAPLEKGMSDVYKIKMENSEISGFNYVLQAPRGSFADSLIFTNTILRDCANGIELAAETDDKGDYNAGCLKIVNSRFENIGANAIHYYRGGYDESTIGGGLSVTGSTFTGCGANEKSDFLIKNRGIINVNISGNSFINNKIKTVALLWGEKNNSESGNTFEGSGKILTELYLKQKLVY